MTIATTIAALQAVNAAITGIVTAPASAADVPSQVESAHLPLVLLWPGRASVVPAGRNLIDSTRRFDGAVLIAGEASGVGIATNTDLIWTYLERFQAAWEPYLTTESELAGGIVVTRYEDSGNPGEYVTYRGKRWAGFVFALDVWEPA